MDPDVRRIPRRRPPTLYEQAVREASRRRRAGWLERAARQGAPALLLLAVAILAGAVTAWQLRSVPSVAALAPERLHISGRERADGLRFEDGFDARRRAMVADAVRGARPEARRLIAEIDGLVDVGFHAGVKEVGRVRDDGGDRLEMTFDASVLDALPAPAREFVILHELGHVIDMALLADGVVAGLDAGIPRDGCPHGPRTGACAPRHERFADTFAAWATRGRGRISGGYRVPWPRDIEAWGAPLADVARRLP